MPVYNKLVRDRIPTIIGKAGKPFTIKTLDEKEYIYQLKMKLQEEVKEYLDTDTNVQAIEELADILEVIHALAEVHGQTFNEVEESRRAKALLRGRFQERYFLMDVDEG